MTGAVPEGPLTVHQQGVLLQLSVTPKAGRNEINGVRNHRLMVRVTAAPEDGKANAAVLKLLAKTLSLPVSQLDLIGGATNRYKTVLARGLTVEQCVAALLL